MGTRALTGTKALDLCRVQAKEKRMLFVSLELSAEENAQLKSCELSFL